MKKFKTIGVSEFTYERLKRLRDPQRRSFDEIITFLLNYYEEKSRKHSWFW